MIYLPVNRYSIFYLHVYFSMFKTGLIFENQFFKEHMCSGLFHAEGCLAESRRRRASPAVPVRQAGATRRGQRPAVAGGAV